MTKLKSVALLIMASALTTSNVWAQSGFANSHPDTYEAEIPNRNLDGSLTPAGRSGLELPDGAASIKSTDTSSTVGMSPRSCAENTRSYEPGSSTFAGRDGNRHSCR